MSLSLIHIFYVNGSLNVFNHQTNVDIHNRLVCFDIKELGAQLRKLGMLIVQDQVWNRVTIKMCIRDSVKVGKGAARLTEQALQKAIQKFLEQKSKPAHGKQTMLSLIHI